MALAPWRPCGWHNCGRLTRGGTCRFHALAYDAARGTAAARGYGAAHRRWRLLVLAACPICRGCGAAPSVIADHIRPVSRGGSWALDNGQGLCWSCHERKKAREKAGGANG